MISGKRCEFCKRWVKPDPRTAGHQRTYGDEVCQKKRKAHTDQTFRLRYPDYDRGRRQKVAQWVREYPNYFRGYRSSHPEYRERERERMQRRREKAKRVAKQVVIRAQSLEKLRDCQEWVRKWGAENVAKQVVIPPSNTEENWAFQGMERLLDYLFLKEGVAKQVGIDIHPPFFLDSPHDEHGDMG